MLILLSAQKRRMGWNKNRIMAAAIFPLAVSACIIFLIFRKRPDDFVTLWTAGGGREQIHLTQMDEVFVQSLRAAPTVASTEGGVFALATDGDILIAFWKLKSTPGFERQEAIVVLLGSWENFEMVGIEKIGESYWIKGTNSSSGVFSMEEASKMLENEYTTVKERGDADHPNGQGRYESLKITRIEMGKWHWEFDPNEGEVVFFEDGTELERMSSRKKFTVIPIGLK